LEANPFPDATDSFFTALQNMLAIGMVSDIQIERPFRSLDKRAVMELGRGAPLEYTFSCIAPVGKLHCGKCNKCAERQIAFQSVGWNHPTTYATPSPTSREQRSTGSRATFH